MWPWLAYSLLDTAAPFNLQFTYLPYAKKAFKYVPNIGTGFYFIHKRPNKVL